MSTLGQIFTFNSSEEEHRSLPALCRLDLRQVDRKDMRKTLPSIHVVGGAISRPGPAGTWAGLTTVCLLL